MKNSGMAMTTAALLAAFTSCSGTSDTSLPSSGTGGVTRVFGEGGTVRNVAGGESHVDRTGRGGAFMGHGPGSAGDHIVVSEGTGGVLTTRDASADGGASRSGAMDRGPAKDGASVGAEVSGATDGARDGAGAARGLGGADGASARAKPPCLKDPSQVAMLGDSYVAAPSYIGAAIVSAAVADGSLASGQSYQDLSVPGTTVNSGQIPSQLDSALAKYPKLKTYITDGCGNDIIQSLVCLAPGSDQNSDCTDIIQECITNFRTMGKKAKAAGVTDVIMFQYPDNVPIGGADILRYGVEEGKKAAAEMSTADFRVYLVDTAPLMKDHPDWYVDGLIHVDSNGAKLIGDTIYDLMKDNCIAQPENLGCCQAW